MPKQSGLLYEFHATAYSNENGLNLATFRIPFVLEMLWGKVSKPELVILKVISLAISNIFGRGKVLLVYIVLPSVGVDVVGPLNWSKVSKRSVFSRMVTLFQQLFSWICSRRLMLGKATKYFPFFVSLVFQLFFQKVKAGCILKCTF
jgi:hypothetical protein